MWRSGSSFQKPIRIRFLPGIRTFSGSFTSSTCVHLVQLEVRELSIPFQTELAIDTNIRVADTQTMVANTQTAVTNSQMVLTDTKTTVTNIEKTVTDIYRDMSVGQKGGSGQNSSVGETRYL